MLPLFQKKNSPSTFLSPKTILCIPGPWTSRSEIVTTIAKSKRNEFIFTGKVLLNRKTNAAFEIEVLEHDFHLKDVFNQAINADKLTKVFLEDIGQHQLIVKVRAKTGSASRAKAIAAAGNALLEAGGIGLKVEPAGKVFSKEQWSSLLTASHSSKLYDMFVVDGLHDRKGTVYSNGMHTLGLKDVIVNLKSSKEAKHLVSAFARFQLENNSDIVPGQTFSIKDENSVFRIQEELEPAMKLSSPPPNPYGMWRLERVS